jgi:hypothetical protein
MAARQRIRLLRYPAARDMEFFARRFLQIGETYEVNGHLATYLVDWGLAAFAPQERSEDEDENKDGHTREPDNGSNDASV